MNIKILMMRVFLCINMIIFAPGKEELITLSNNLHESISNARAFSEEVVNKFRLAPTFSENEEFISQSLKIALAAEKVIEVLEFSFDDNFNLFVDNFDSSHNEVLSELRDILKFVVPEVNSAGILREAITVYKAVSKAQCDILIEDIKHICLPASER